MRGVLVLGATSAIAQAVAKRFARDGRPMFIVARDQRKLDVVAAELKTQGSPKVIMFVADLADYSQHQLIISEATSTVDFDTVLFAWGKLSDQKVCEANFSEALADLHTNFLSAVSLLTLVANQFEQTGKGVIAVITSVAGDRGRQSNYIYGSGKSALSTFLQGLRNRLHPRGVRVVTIKPGFVDTPMTAHLKKNALFASPEVVGRGIYNAIVKGKDVVYLPWFWFWIMLAVKHLPEPIFKRLKL